MMINVCIFSPPFHCLYIRSLHFLFFLYGPPFHPFMPRSPSCDLVNIFYAAKRTNDFHSLTKSHFSFQITPQVKLSACSDSLKILGDPEDATTFRFAHRNCGWPYAIPLKTCVQEYTIQASYQFLEVYTTHSVL